MNARRIQFAGSFLMLALAIFCLFGHTYALDRGFGPSVLVLIAIIACAASAFAVLLMCAATDPR